MLARATEKRLKIFLNNLLMIKKNKSMEEEQQNVHKGLPIGETKEFLSAKAEKLLFFCVRRLI